MVFRPGAETKILRSEPTPVGKVTPTSRRLRPILMTALAAAVGMPPLALAIGVGSQMLQLLAIATIGGLLIATVLSSIVMPAIYYYLTRQREGVSREQYSVTRP